MAILISQKNASSNSSSAAALTAYTFNAAAANSSLLNMFFGLSTVKETLNYSGGSLRVADVSSGDVFNITDVSPNTAIGIYTSGNSIVVTNSSKTYTFGAIAASETFNISFGTGAKEIVVTRTVDAYDFSYALDAAGGTVAITSSSAALDVISPTATVTTLYTNNIATNAVVQTSQAGTVYLVKNTLPVTTSTNLATLESTYDSYVNHLDIATANISANQNLALTGLDDGVYNVYSVDVAGNVSAASTGTVTIVTDTNGTIGSPVLTQTGWNDIIDGNQGSISSSVTFDATGGGDIYLIAADSDANIVINGFTATSDKLVFDLGSAYTTTTFASFYTVTDNGTDTVLTSNNDGVTQTITLKGINQGSITGIGDTIDTLAELDTVLSDSSGLGIGYNALYASATGFGAIFHTAATIGLYDSTGLIIGSATSLIADTLNTLTASAQSAITSATLKVIDTATGTTEESASVILGTASDDAAIAGGANNEYIFGFGGSDSVSAGAGDDTIIAGAGSDTVNGDAGNDTIIFGTELTTAGATDVVNGGDGTDTLTFTDNGVGTDDLDSVTNVEIIVLGDAATSITAVTGLVAAGKSLTLDGSALTSANDLTFVGTAETDGGMFSIIGGAGSDSITGGSGIDTIFGGAGSDTIDGGDGSDTIFDGAGVDSIIGGAGNDTITLTSGDGAADSVSFSDAVAADTDVITGFTTTSDNLEFTGVVLTGGGTAIAATSGTTATSGNVTAGALATNSVYVISNGATALTSGGTQSISNYTDLADVASYLAEGYTSTANNDAAIFVINDLVADKTYIYMFDETTASASTISSAELSLIGVVTEVAGAALVAGDIG